MILKGEHPDIENTGWFSIGNVGDEEGFEDDHNLDDYRPEHFTLFKEKQSWQESEDYLHGLKVLAFYDDCGHMVAFNVSTPSQELKILEGIFKEAAKEGSLEPVEKKEAKKLLEERKIEELYELLEDKIPALNARGGPSVVYVDEAWRTGLGVLE